MSCPKCSGFVSADAWGGDVCVNCGWSGETRAPTPEDDPRYGYPVTADGRVRYPSLPDYLPGGVWDYEMDVNA